MYTSKAPENIFMYQIMNQLPENLLRVYDVTFSNIIFNRIRGPLLLSVGPQKPQNVWCLSVPFGLYAALFHPAVECILNLQGLFKSEVPVVIFLHLVFKIK